MHTMLCNPVYHTVPNAGLIWQEVVRLSLRLGCSALIDCGALTVGATNGKIALFLCRQQDFFSRFRGVIFFDTGLGCWAILDEHGQIQPKHLSPIDTRECFAFFDESRHVLNLLQLQCCAKSPHAVCGRSRGSDIKLPQNAVGLVTVGPKMSKAKLMQAIGRLRLLHMGQTFMFVGTGEVSAKMAQIKHAQLNLSFDEMDLSSADLLRWVVYNDIQSDRDALVQWARQGATFATSRTPGAAILDEVLDLESMYASSLLPQKASEIIGADIRRLKRRLEVLGIVDDRCELLLAGICGRGDALGCDFEVVSSTYEEEHERELEKEQELMEETEVQVGKRDALDEDEWDYHHILSGGVLSASALPALGCKIQQLNRQVKKNSCLGAIEVVWPANIWCTENFDRTVKPVQQQRDYRDSYRRSVDSVLLFPSANEIVLISDREANGMLPHFQAWSGNGRRSEVCLTTFAFLRDAEAEGSADLLLPLKQAIRPSPFWLLGDSHSTMLAALQLFMGELHYPKEERQLALQSFLHHQCSGSRKQLVDKLVAMRGTTHAFPRSDLEKIIVSAPWMQATW
jgi:hypothetical protein